MPVPRASEQAGASSRSSTHKGERGIGVTAHFEQLPDPRYEQLGLPGTYAKLWPDDEERTRAAVVDVFRNLADYSGTGEAGPGLDPLR